MIMQATTPNTRDFDAAVAAYLAAPTWGNLLAMDRAAAALLGTAPPAPWRPITDPDAFAPDFYEIRAVCDTALTEEEVSRLSGCLGYALAEVLCGEGLSDPTISRPTDGASTFTVLEFGFDVTKSRRDDPDAAEAFARAARYIAEGSPVRRTDRRGHNTRGTRLVEGIGQGRCNISFFVR